MYNLVHDDYIHCETWKGAAFNCGKHRPIFFTARRYAERGYATEKPSPHWRL